MNYGKVLVIDDSEQWRSMLAEGLEAGGFEVTQAADGSHALLFVREQRFDVILSDLHMPGMGGLTFVQRLRELDGCKDVPVVMLSSDVSKDRHAEGKKVGVQAWLIKPPNMPELVAALKTLALR